MAPNFPPIRSLLPQQGEMCLLARVLEHDAVRTCCEVADPRGGLFADEAGGVPSYVALEWMAQCASAHAALRVQGSGAAPLRGLLLGTRSLELRRPRVAAGEVLEVEARHVSGELGLVVFAASVYAVESVNGAGGTDGAERVVVASGRINLFAEPLPAS